MRSSPLLLCYAGVSVNTGQDPQLAVVGGIRDAFCNAVLRIRYNSSANLGLNGHFRLVRYDLGAAPLNADVYLPNGYDTTVSIPERVCGNGTTPIFGLARLNSSSGSWVACKCVSSTCHCLCGCNLSSFRRSPRSSTPVTVPSACAVAAATPVCNKPSGSWTTNNFMWVQISSATPGGFLYVTTDGSDPLTSPTAVFRQVRSPPLHSILVALTHIPGST